MKFLARSAEEAKKEYHLQLMQQNRGPKLTEIHQLGTKTRFYFYAVLLSQLPPVSNYYMYYFSLLNYDSNKISLVKYSTLVN